MSESPATPTTPITPITRTVPGAPPPAPLTKSQIKRRLKSTKAKGEGTDGGLSVSDARSAALIDKAPVAGAVTPDLTAEGDAGGSQSATGEKKLSPVQELLHKKFKGVHKKIQRIETYSSKPESELNQDQIRTLKTLPALEAVARELEELTKAVEVVETTQHKEAKAKKVEEEAAIQARIDEAVRAAHAQTLTKHHILLGFLGLASMLSGSHPHNAPTPPNLGDQDRVAIQEASAALLDWPGTPEIAERKDGVLVGLLGDEETGKSVAEVAYARLRMLATQFIHPPTPIPSPPAAPTSLPDVEGPGTSATGSQVDVAPQQVSGSFHFMQESELDNGVATATTSIVFGDPTAASADWVQVDASTAEPAQVMSESVEQLVENEQEVISAAALSQQNGSAASGAPRAPLDWAADEHEDSLPPIATLHEKFGKSGSATPETSQTPGHGEDAPLSAVSQLADAQTPQTPTGEDEWSQPRGPRSRGHHDRGGYRGHGGEDGRGRGRGRGEGRGGYRGRGRGNHPNGAEGENGRGAWRGRNPSGAAAPPSAGPEEEGWTSVGGGDHRGRRGGRGGYDNEGHRGDFRGRRTHGGFRVNRGGPPPQQTQTPPS